jgi:hypothetical protein
MHEHIAEVIVLTDEHEGYYLLTREALEQARIPADRQEELKRALATGDDGDVSGFITPIPIPGARNFQVLGTFHLQTGLIKTVTPAGVAGFDPSGGLGRSL